MIPPTHNRHTTRLPGYDYTQPGGYYVTIVTRGREPVLGAVVAGSVALSIPGVIVQKAWCDLPQHFANVRLDEFVIMPNHVHGIIIITDDTPRHATCIVGCNDPEFQIHICPPHQHNSKHPRPTLLAAQLL